MAAAEITGWDAVRMIAEGFAFALVQWWYVWLLVVVVGVGLAALNNWSKRLERRGSRKRR